MFFSSGGHSEGKGNKPQQEGITTKPGDKELFILILQKISNNN